MPYSGTPPNMLDLFSSFIAGFRLLDGSDASNLARLVCGNQSALTALAGGGATGATPLVPGTNQVTVVGTTGDSVILPLAIPGTPPVIVVNDSGATLDVYAQASNPQLAAAAADKMAPDGSITYATTALTIATAVVNIFVCTALGKWKQIAIT